MPHERREGSGEAQLPPIRDGKHLDQSPDLRLVGLRDRVLQVRRDIPQSSALVRQQEPRGWSRHPGDHPRLARGESHGF